MATSTSNNLLQIWNPLAQTLIILNINREILSFNPYIRFY